MVFDELMKLRADGASPEVDASETGGDSLTVRTTQGELIIEVNGTPLRGLAVVVVHPLVSGSSGGFVVSIEAADEIAFNVTNETICTFPSIDDGDAANLLVRRIHTKKKYIRSLIAWTTDAEVTTCDILVGDMIEEED